MSYRSYLASQLASAFIVCATAGLCCFILVVSGIGWPLALLVSGLVLGAALLSSVASWLQRRSFYEDLEHGAADVEHPLWIAEMADRPDFIEGEITCDALRAISKAANDDVAEYRRQVKDYREYVETWVHEAKTPLAAAHLMLENLVESVPADANADIVFQKASALEEEIERVEGYIEQALFFARSETLDRDYLIRSHSLKDLVSSAIKANARMMIAAHVAPVQRGLELEVFTDDKWMEFILGQLIQNSVKYARAEGATIEFSGRLLNSGKADESIELCPDV